VHSPQTSDIIALVLAAGSAARFGSSKQLAELDGMPLARRALAVAANVFGNHTALVVGHDWQAVAQSCSPLPGFLIMNDLYKRGLGSSIACATRSVRHAAQAIVVILADQPLVSAGHLRNLRDNWSGADNEIVATGFGRLTVRKIVFEPASVDIDTPAALDRLIRR
jgi:molybdenum cofactor cytidylyltransferase